MNTTPESRKEIINRIAQYLQKKSHPRVLLFAILLVTGITGVVASFGMLRFGITQMFIRYPLSATIAYAMFLFLLRLWRNYETSQPDISSKVVILASETTQEDPVVLTKESDRKSDSKRNYFDSIDLLNIDIKVCDAEGFYYFVIFLILLPILIVGVTFVIDFILSTAPTLLAEVLLDGLIVTGLWSRLKNSEEVDNPLGTAFYITRGPAFSVIIALCVIGYMFGIINPTAKSIGDIMKSFFNK